MNKRNTLFVFAIFLLLSAQLAVAQNTEVSCRAFFRTALDTALAVCSDTGNDEICYGNFPVTMSPNADFDEPGSTAPLSSVSTVQTEIGDFSQVEYGVTFARFHAGIPDEAVENTTMVLFGNTEVTNLVDDPPTLPMTATTGINVRVGPADDEGLAGSVAAGAVVTATGRTVNAAGEEWIRIDFQEHRNRIGWIIGWALTSEGSRDDLLEVQPGDLILNPMQEMQIRTGMADAPCEPASESGVLIQTPPDYAPLTFTINGALLELNGTAFLQSDDEFMYVTNLSGDVAVWADEVRQMIPTGALSRVALGEIGVITARPQFPEGYVYSVLERLPLELLPRSVELVTPLTPGEIIEFLTPPQDFPQSGLWTVSGEPAGCWPNPDSDPVFSSDYFLGTGTLTIEEDAPSFTFTGGRYGTSVHTLVAPDTYTFADEAPSSVTTFTTRIVDYETLETVVEFAYSAADGNCTSGKVWTWKPVVSENEG